MNRKPATPADQVRKDQATTAPLQDEFHQGQAHVSNPGKVERSATAAAAKQGRKPAPEGNTPGGMSS